MGYPRSPGRDSWHQPNRCRMPQGHRHGLQMLCGLPRFPSHIPSICVSGRSLGLARRSRPGPESPADQYLLWARILVRVSRTCVAHRHWIGTPRAISVLVRECCQSLRGVDADGDTILPACTRTASTFRFQCRVPRPYVRLRHSCVLGIMGRKFPRDISLWYVFPSC